jgi:hypothetical protein
MYIQDAQQISSAMKSNFLFQHLNSAQKNELISLMQVMMMMMMKILDIEIGYMFIFVYMYI